MKIEVAKTEFRKIRTFHDQYLAGVDYQIVHATVLPRGLADPYMIRIDRRPVAHGAVWNAYYPGRVVEFHRTARCEVRLEEIFRVFVQEAKVLSMEAQTNMPTMYSLLTAFGKEAQEDKILFEDAGPSSVPDPGADIIEVNRSKSGSEWVVQVGREVVARGGYLTHYNPPFADIYMEVEEHARGRGFGSYLVQELKEVCYDRGFRPAARCNPDNEASRRALERAGFRECARLLSSEVDPQKAIAT